MPGTEQFLDTWNPCGSQVPIYDRGPFVFPPNDSAALKNMVCGAPLPGSSLTSSLYDLGQVTTSLSLNYFHQQNGDSNNSSSWSLMRIKWRRKAQSAYMISTIFLAIRSFLSRPPPRHPTVVPSCHHSSVWFLDLLVQWEQHGPGSQEDTNFNLLFTRD